MALYGPNYDPNEIGDASLGKMQALYGGLTAYGGGQYIPSGWTRSIDTQSALQGARGPAFQSWAQSIAANIPGASVEFDPSGAANITLPNGRTQSLTQWHYDDWTKRGIDPVQALNPTASTPAAPVQGETLAGPSDGQVWGGFGGPTSGGNLAGQGAAGRVSRFAPVTPLPATNRPILNPSPQSAIADPSGARRVGRTADPVLTDPGPTLTSSAPTGALTYIGNPAASGAPGLYDPPPASAGAGPSPETAHGYLTNPAASGAVGMYEPAPTQTSSSATGAYNSAPLGAVNRRYPTPRPITSYASSASSGAYAPQSAQTSRPAQSTSSTATPKWESSERSYAPRASSSKYSMYAPAKGGY